MRKEHPEKPFERYADDIVVHCKTEKQALFVLGKIRQRMNLCKLTLHPVKTRIVNLRGKSEKKYPKSYDFLGFMIRPNGVKFKDKFCVIPGIFVSKASKKSILQKFEGLKIHKRRTSIEVLAKELRPVISGIIINYFHKFSHGHMRYVWYQLNVRLLKWVKWEKGLYKQKSIKWLKEKYRSNPGLFPHCKLVHP